MGAASARTLSRDARPSCRRAKLRGRLVLLSLHDHLSVPDLAEQRAVAAGGRQYDEYGTRRERDDRSRRFRSARAMKAAVFHQVGKPLTIEDIPYPKPRAHQVVIKVGRCGFCATDVAMTSGEGMTFTLGAALGHEYCGEVVEVGPDVSRLRVGDLVAAMPEGGCGVCAPC